MVSANDYSMEIRKLRAALGLTQHEFAELLHVRPPVVASWEQGRKEPSARSYQELAKLAPAKEAWFFLGKLGVTPELLEAKGLTEKSNSAMLPPEVRILTADDWKNGAKGWLSYQVQVPVLRDEAAAVSVADALPEQIETFITVPATKLPKGPGAYSAMYVRENSMEPILRSGYIVVVDRTRRNPMELRGHCVAVWANGAAVLRVLSPDSTAERLILKAQNAAYPDIVVESPAESPILGEVVFWWGA